MLKQDDEQGNHHHQELERQAFGQVSGQGAASTPPASNPAITCQ